MEVYIEASGTTNKPKQRQTAVILHCAGPQVLEVYDHFQFDQEDDKNDPAKVLEKLEEYCNPRENEVLCTVSIADVFMCSQLLLHMNIYRNMTESED